MGWHLSAPETCCYVGYEINTLFVSEYGYPEIRAIRIRHDSRGNDDGPVLVLGVVPLVDGENLLPHP